MYLCIPDNYKGLIYGSWNNFKEPLKINDYNFKINSNDGLNYFIYIINPINSIEYFYIVDNNSKILINEFNKNIYNEQLFNIVKYNNELVDLNINIGKIN